MKRFGKPKHSLDIVAVLTDFAQSSEILPIQHPQKIKKKFLVSEEQRIAYEDFIHSILSVLYENEFQIIKNHQSTRSNSVYIDFYPVDAQGNRLELAQIRFRISNYAPTCADSFSSNGSRAMFKTFIVGGKPYPSTISVMNVVSTICEDLKQGNYEMLDTN